MCETRNIHIPAYVGGIDLSRPHLVAIGGAGMSALAHLLVRRGAHVSGSDIRTTDVTRALAAVGCHVHLGHDAAHVDDPSVVVWSSGVEQDTPELVAARAAGVPVVHRSHVLAQLLSEAHRSVVVGGTHGKSSTTAMLATALRSLSPSWAGGGALIGGVNAAHGSGGVFVAEGDESDRSIAAYRPDVAVVLNVDDDHPETYVDRDDVLGVFETFARGSRHLVASADDEGTRALVERVRSSCVDVTTVGESEGADFRVVAIEQQAARSRVVVREPDGATTSFTVRVPGGEMALNAAAAFVAGRVLGVDASELADGLGRFQGIQRRMSMVGEASGVIVRDSFAHHARAIEADLAAGRALTSERLIVAFQPCGWTRTMAQGPDLGRALAVADEVVLLDVHSTVTPPFSGMTTEGLEKAVVEHGGRLHRVHGHEQAADVVASLTGPGDLVLTMGTGDVTALGTVILARTRAGVVTA
ncbi:UDP-N-acetylmuramate--L-alanine ligase [Streptomyces sp. NPDC090025]|uniref:UDP-N-acetylmuramate--L-alanine ligase n=1 Tax=Streptomyces sp. NPDC090025 TaxID=3365922 RepID=UPI003835CFFA